MEQVPTPDSLPSWLRELLRCPACRSELQDGADELRCTGADCGLRYRIEHGIPVLLVDEARSPES